MKAKLVDAWCIVDPDGKIIPMSARRNKNNAMKDYPDGGKSWATFEAKGYTCRPVVIMENESAPSRAKENET